MKRVLLSLMTVLACIYSMEAANVTVKMNSTSQFMYLVNKATADTVAVGLPESRTYTFDAQPGTYVLTALAKDTATVNGTIEITVTDEAEQLFEVLTCTTYASNKNWVFGTDYTINVEVNSREGQRQVITLGNSTTAGRKTFLACKGNSYYVSFIPSAEHQAEGYMTKYSAGTLTAGITVQSAIPMGVDFVMTTPVDAELFMGIKFSHFTAFTEVKPEKVEVQGTTMQTHYRLAQSQVYNLRTWREGGLTQGGYFQVPTNVSDTLSFTFTDADYEAFAPHTIKHDVNWNGGYETGDILVNINERGHLQMKVGDTYDALAMRSWQLTDTQTNNYFLEPDFHYTVIDLEGNPSTGVIEIDNAHTTTDPWATIRAVGNGTAIVLVSYDAIGLNIYKYNTSSKTIEKTPYMGGEYWGAIWPENTAAYVVTVGDGATAMNPNMVINEEYNKETLKNAGKYVDAEHDVFYYLDTEEGATYTFMPTDVEKVEIAYPTIGERMATYKGFGTTGVTKNDDGSYTLLLKEGRQIVRLTDGSGNAVYQVLTAKACHREITNASREGSQIFQPGDKVKIQYSGLHHPSNKLAGIYNMSAYVTYNGIPNGSSLILGSGQYTFGSVASAQAVTIDIPADHNIDSIPEMVMNEGVIQVNGFGDPIGAHRQISREIGRSPNFTAIAHKTYFGVIPEVRIALTSVKNFTIRPVCDVDSVTYTISYGDSILQAADNTYVGTYGTYSITAVKKGYRCYRSTFTIGDNAEGEQLIHIAMEEADSTAWDGESLVEPDSIGDIYQIASGAELAWYAAHVNEGNYEAKAVLTANIDLANFDWTPIGGAKSGQAFQGTFDGQGHTISGLYINNTLTYQALFGYTKSATISRLTIEGTVSAKQYVAGIVAYMAANTTVDRLVNKANVSGSSTYVGGITGSASAASSVVTNCYNTGDIKGTSNCAGVVGYNHKDATISNIFNIGNVTGSNVAACVGGTAAKTKVTNAFALAEYKITDGQTTVTAEQMASGEVAYHLGEAFGQQLGRDAHPVLGGKKVYYDAEGDVYHNEKYQLTIIIDTETIAIDSVAYGDTIVLPQIEVREGYTFAWGETPEMMPAHDVTCEGTYSINSYKVYYYVGNELIHTVEVTYGDAIPEYTYEPTNENDTFMGWMGETYETMPAHDVTYTANIESNVLQLTVNNAQLTIYDLAGRKVTDTENLKGGIYIINGKKVIIK